MTASETEVATAIQKVEEAVDQSTELDDIDKSDLKASLNVIRDLAATEATPKAKLKIAEKLAAIAATVEACEKLGPVVKTAIGYVKAKLGIP